LTEVMYTTLVLADPLSCVGCNSRMENYRKFKFGRYVPDSTYTVLDSKDQRSRSL